MDTTYNKEGNERLPAFIIAGAQKCGTTTLHHQLQSHPEIYFPSKPQEIHFFDNEYAYKKGMSWYSEYFKNAAANQLAGQTSPLYLYLECAAHRIKQHLPNIKIIIILRHPVERAYSHYWNSVRYGYEKHSFEHAIKIESNRIKKGEQERRNFSYIDRGMYTRQLELYKSLFGSNNMLVLTQDNLKSNPLLVLNQCCEFLGVDKTYYLESKIGIAHNPSRLPICGLLQSIRPSLEHNRIDFAVRLLDKLNLRKKQYPPMNPATRSQLTNIFSDEINTVNVWLAQNTGSKIQWT